MAKAISKTTLSIAKMDDGSIVITGTVGGDFYAWSNQHALPYVKGNSDLVPKVLEQIEKFGAYFTKRASEAKVSVSSNQTEDFDVADLEAPAKPARKSKKAESVDEAFGYEQAI